MERLVPAASVFKVVPTEAAGPMTEGVDDIPEAARQSAVMVSTALVFGFLAARNTLSAQQHATEMAKTARALAGVRDVRGRGFTQLTQLFTAMLFSANIPRGKKWLVRIRLWQLILLQARPSMRRAPRKATAADT